MELLRKMDEAEGAADGLEDRLDSLLGSLDGMLGALEGLGTDEDEEGEKGGEGEDDLSRAEVGEAEREVEAGETAAAE